MWFFCCCYLVVTILLLLRDFHSQKISKQNWMIDNSIVVDVVDVWLKQKMCVVLRWNWKNTVLVLVVELRKKFSPSIAGLVYWVFGCFVNSLRRRSGYWLCSVVGRLIFSFFLRNVTCMFNYYVSIATYRFMYVWDNLKCLFVLLLIKNTVNVK